MQIYEIFQTKESILKGVANKVGAVAGAVASNLGGQILSKAGLDPNAGLGTKNPFGDKEAAAEKAAEPLIQRQADDLYKKWTAAKNTNPAALKQSLNSVVHNTLLQSKLGKDYTDLNGWVDADPLVQQRAAMIEKQIGTALNNITNAVPKDTAPAWEQLVRATNQAMQLINFHPKKYSSVGTGAMPRVAVTPKGWTIGNTVLAPGNPAHAPIIQILNAQRQQLGNTPKLKQTPQGIMVGSQLVGPNQPAYQTLANIVDGGTTAPVAKTAPPPSSGASIGGEPLDPNDPASQQILAAMKKQGIK